MGDRSLRNLIKDVIDPPLTTELVALVAESRERKSRQVEEQRGPKAAARHRAATEKVMGRMARRRIAD